jgi:hypothetical protein
MARMTRKMVDEIMGVTNSCYRDALITYHKKFLKKHNIGEPITVGFLKNYLLGHNKPIHNEDINRLYLANMLKLSTNWLELILEAHNKEKIVRKPLTIIAIADELFERSANSESTEKHG